MKKVHTYTKVRKKIITMGNRDLKKEKKQESNICHPWSIMLSDANKTKETRVKQVRKLFYYSRSTKAC